MQPQEQTELLIAKNREELSRIYVEHPTLHKMTTTDANIYAWFAQASHGRCTIEEALIGALIHVTETKEKLFEEVIELNANASPKQ